LVLSLIVSGFSSFPNNGFCIGEKIIRVSFSGILPEETNRETIAKNLGITSKNDYSMLKEIGGECAGSSCARIKSIFM
jgi:HipA-like protein